MPHAFPLRRQLATEAVSGDGRSEPLVALAARSPLALAGIARPQAFFGMLTQAGCPPADTLGLPDHHDFRNVGDLPAGRCLICTEKDAVKLWRSRPDAWAVPLEVSIGADFWLALEAWLGPRLSSTDGPETA